MASILSAFGIDWRLLLIDTLNFGIVLFALWYFLYEPLIKILNERQQKVAQGVVDAEAAKERLSEIEGSRADILAKAGHEADEVLVKARKSASDKEHELIQQGESAAARLMQEAQAQAKELKVQALIESREEVAKLIVLGVEKAAIGHK